MARVFSVAGMTQAPDISCIKYYTGDKTVRTHILQIYKMYLSSDLFLICVYPPVCPPCP